MQERTDDESTADVEEQNTNINTLNGLGQTATRDPGLTGSDGDDLSADEENAALETTAH